MQEQVAESLAEPASQLRWNIARVGQVLWFQQKKLARALHGPVQSSITAAAIRMDAVVRAGGDPEPLMPEVRAPIVASLGLLSATPASVTSFQLYTDRLIGTWEGIAHVHVGIDEETRALLMADSITAVPIELMSSSLANCQQRMA